CRLTNRMCVNALLGLNCAHCVPAPKGPHQSSSSAMHGVLVPQSSKSKGPEPVNSNENALSAFATNGDGSTYVSPNTAAPLGTPKAVPALLHETTLSLSGPTT